MSQPTFSRTYMDYSREKSNVQVFTKTIAGANISEFDEIVNTTELGAFAAAMDAMSILTPNSGQVSFPLVKLSEIPPTDENAQRENVLVVTYQDNVTKDLYRVSIPGPDWTSLHGDHTDHVNQSALKWTTFKAAFEVIGRSKAGNTITVIDGVFGGRRK